MAYNYDAEQQAAIDKFLTDAKEFCTKFVNGEGADASTFNKRLNEIQGILAYLNENKQDSIFITDVEPGSPEANALWIDTTSSPASYKYYDGSDWVEIGNTQAGVTNLSSLTDVAITTPTTGQVLKFDGTKWVNSSDLTGGDSSSPTAGFAQGTPVRQTVLTGRVDGNGQANFLEAGAGLAINLKASQVPVEVAFAAGFHKGALDYVERIDADVDAAWTLPPNATSFLYIDRDPNAGLTSYGLSSLVPVYQTTAPSTPASDRHWFDLSTMTMKVWNGSDWVEKQRVFIGEAVTDGSGVVSVITYALQGRYDSGRFPVSASTTYLKNHNIGTVPSSFALFGTNIVGNPLYPVTSYMNSTSFNGGSVTEFNRNTIKVVTHVIPRFIHIPNAHSTAVEMSVIVERGW